MGLPFFCFYDDALLLGKIGDLKLQFWGTRPFVLTFPKSHGFFTEKLISLGYKVATVEQTETELTKKDIICKREIVEILTKGTVREEKFWNGESDPKFLLCVLQKKDRFGITFVDCMTQTFFFDEVKQIEDLKSIIYRVKPVEIVSIKGFLEMSLLVFMRNVSSPVFSQCCIVMPTIEEIFREWEEFFKGNSKEKQIINLYE